MSWMHSKSESTRPETPRAVAEPRPKPKPDREARTAPVPSQERAAAGNATIGRSIQIEGTLTGNEDLTIDGKINGKISLRGHVLTIGPNGAIDAHLRAKSIVIQGDVSGNVSADDKVHITASGSVKGDIRAPRLALDDGARFKGGVDMGETSTDASTKPIGSDAARKTPRLAGGAN